MIRKQNRDFHPKRRRYFAYRRAKGWIPRIFLVGKCPGRRSIISIGVETAGGGSRRGAGSIAFAIGRNDVRRTCRAQSLTVSPGPRYFGISYKKKRVASRYNILPTSTQILAAQENADGRRFPATGPSATMLWQPSIPSPRRAAGQNKECRPSLERLNPHAEALVGFVVRPEIALLICDLRSATPAWCPGGRPARPDYGRGLDSVTVSHTLECLRRRKWIASLYPIHYHG